MSNQLRVWMRLATPEEQELLAASAGTSRAYLYHIAADAEAGYRRSPRIELAAGIEAATKLLNKQTKGRLPVVYRIDLVKGCRDCPFAEKALGRRAVIVSEFDSLD